MQEITISTLLTTTIISSVATDIRSQSSVFSQRNALRGQVSCYFIVRAQVILFSLSA